MKVAVIGAGAIGCVTGALLWDNGYDVVLVGRPDNVSAINANGLVIDGIPGGKRYNVPARESLDFEPGMVFLAVKTQDVEAACRTMLPHAKNAVIVTMQNGVKCDELAAGVLGKDRIVSSVVMFGATYLEPGHVTYNFPGGLIIGKAFPVLGDDMVVAVHELLSSVFDTYVSADIHGAHWTKLILNLNNALAGAIGMSLQDTFSDPALCRVGVALMGEAYGAMGAAGIDLTSLPDLPAERLRGLFDAPLEVSSGIYGGIMRGLSGTPLPGSVLQSIRRGKPTEVEHLNGEIVTLGKGHGFPTPLNARVTELVKEASQTGRFIDKERLMKEMSV